MMPFVEYFSCARASLVSVLAVAAAGCASPRLPEPEVSFDAGQARAMLATGNNTLQGSALLRQAGGGVVTCAGVAVYLMPVTAAAKDWAVRSFGSEAGGFRQVDATGPQFRYGASEFMTSVKTATCDAAGNFKFEEVADGEWYVFTRILWSIPIRFGTELQGGTLMQPVKLAGGATRSVVLSRPRP